MRCCPGNGLNPKIDNQNISLTYTGKSLWRKLKEELTIKGAQSRLNGLKSLAKLFNIVVFQSVSIFSILNHPRSVMLCYNLFGVFLSLHSIIFSFPSI